MCYFCGFIPTKIDYENRSEFYIFRYAINDFNLDACGNVMKIFYCPVCGKKLEDDRKCDNCEHLDICSRPDIKKLCKYADMEHFNLREDLAIKAKEEYEKALEEHENEEKEYRIQHSLI